MPPPRSHPCTYFVRRDDPLHQVGSRLRVPGILAVDVSGIQGSGKTTFLTEVYDEVQRTKAGHAAWVSIRGLRPAERRDGSLASLERDFYAFCDLVDAFARELGCADFTQEVGALRNVIADIPERTVNVTLQQNVKLGLLSRIQGDVQWGDVRIDAEELAPDFFRRVVELARLKVRDEFAERLRSLSGDGRPVLFADDFELALQGQLGEWFLELVGKLDDALVVVARADSLRVLGSLAGALVELQMPNFDREELGRYLTERFEGVQVPDELANRIAVLTGGHPQALVLAADVVRSHGVDRADVLTLFDDVRGELKEKLASLVRRLVEEIAERDVRQAVEVGSVLRRFDASALNDMLDRTEDDAPLIPDLCEFSFTEQHLQPETGETYYRFHEFIRSEMDAQLECAKPKRYRELHERAAVYYSNWLTACEETDRDKAAYCRAYRYERPHWQAMVREWLYHLSRLGDEQASLEVARVYLAAFWWWGCYLRFPFCERLLREWELADGRPHVREVAALLRAFQTAYPPQAEPEVVDADWLRVEDAVSELIDLDAEAGLEADDNARWRRTQLRAYLQIFLAHARRGQDPADPKIDEAYACAHEELSAFGHDDDAWNLPWIVYELGDLALERGDLAEAARRGAAVVEQAGGDIRFQDNEVLANAHRLLGDVACREGDTERAVEQYSLAMLHAFALQAMPKPADFYTITFYDRIARHVCGQLGELCSPLPSARAASVLAASHDFWAEYWRRAGEPVLAAAPVEMVAAGRVDELAPYLFPRQPGADDVGPGSDYVTTAKRVAKATFAHCRNLRRLGGASGPTSACDGPRSS